MSEEPVMAAIRDAIEWKEDILPFPTHKNDWALWIHPEAGRWMFIEQALIKQVMAAVPEEPDTKNHWHDCFMGIGHKILKYLMSAGDPEPGMVRVCQFAGCPVDVRFGKFDGRMFVFTPRYDIEKKWEEIQFKSRYGGN